jgi:hypothetical protein
MTTIVRSSPSSHFHHQRGVVRRAVSPHTNDKENDFSSTSIILKEENPLFICHWRWWNQDPNFSSAYWQNIDTTATTLRAIDESSR